MNSNTEKKLDQTLNLKLEFEKLLNSDNLKLPMLPEVSFKVINLINNPNSSLNDISAIIQQDQAIATHILRIANSAAYAPTTEIVSINQAISRLGFKLLSEIIISISLQLGIFNSKLFKNEMVHLWRFSLLTGLWAKRISFHKKYNVEATFIGGLLHEIGKPILLNSLSKILDNKEYNEDELNLLINEYHLVLSKKVMAEWNLPKLVSSITCNYNNINECVEYKKEATIVYLAHQLAKYSLAINNPNDEQNQSSTNSIENNENKDNPMELIFKLPQWADLNYYRDEIEDLIAENETVTQTLNSMVV